MVKIYALFNPLNGCVFYVGASIEPKKRFSSHITANHWSPVTHRYKQIMMLREKGMLPELMILDECEKIDTRFWEEFYIELFKSWGFKLTQNKASAYMINDRQKITVPTSFIKISTEVYKEMMDYISPWGVGKGFIEMAIREKLVRDKANKISNLYQES